MEPRNYRMVVSTAQDYVATAAEADRQLHRWLDGKKYDTSALDEGRNELAPGVTLDHDAASGRHGSYSRWRLREARGGIEGTWLSSLVVRAEDPARTWVQVDIEHLPAMPGLPLRRPSTPGIARMLLDVLDAQDGLADVSTVAKFIEPGDVDEVIEELCDQDRRLPIVVATVPYGKDATAWTERVVERAYAHLAGLAVMYVLTPQAETPFNRALEYHSVFGGGVRTYLPGVDPAWKPDAQRHLVMSRPTLEENPGRAAATLAHLPQRLARRLPLPAPLDNLPLQRTRPRRAADGSADSAGAEALRAENKTLQAMLDEAEQRESASAEVVRDLRNQLQVALELDFDQAAENQDIYAKLKHAEREVRSLRVRLEQHGLHQLAYAPAERPTGQPETFTEILDRMGEFPHLRFTGNPKITRGLDAQSIGNWVEVAWDALCALNEYAAASAAGTAGGDFRHWCDNTPEDRKYLFPSGKVKMKESETVGNRSDWRRERTFPVPETVARKGSLFMQAHLRIGGGNTVASRLYFHDDCANTGLVYVGCIGPHPSNTKS